ncbi:hypothetical protein PAHAL_5G184800 [Panicum hallii]|uniref:Uncharacterized protein n=1 Tax=Panicum hallii TaxID=206008 RepID=A0A2T8IKD2_9POAL|nr:hypothetical protein PAHAL_5G184800 [Panicum hallii]
MASGPDPPLVVRHLGARHRGPQSTANRLVRRRRGCEVVPPMARRRRKGRKTLRDDLRAAARRTSTRQIWRRATRPSWSPASSHPRCRAGLEALRAASTGHAPAAGRRTRSPVAYIIGWHTRTPEQADLPAAAPACSLVVCLIRWPDRRCRQPLG